MDTKITINPEVQWTTLFTQLPPLPIGILLELDQFLGHGLNRGKLKANVEEFLNTPEPEPSPLILPPAFEAQRRRDLHKARFTAFLEEQVEEQTKPVLETVKHLREKRRQQDNRESELMGLNEALGHEVDALKKQLAQLQNYKARVEAATAPTGERSRLFRAED